jgi:hypothetical protein
LFGGWLQGEGTFRIGDFSFRVAASPGVGLTSESTGGIAFKGGQGINAAIAQNLDWNGRSVRIEASYNKQNNFGLETELLSGRVSIDLYSRQGRNQHWNQGNVPLAVVLLEDHTQNVQEAKAFIALGTGGNGDVVATGNGLQTGSVGELTPEKNDLTILDVEDFTAYYGSVFASGNVTK